MIGPSQVMCPREKILLTVFTIILFAYYATLITGFQPIFAERSGIPNYNMFGEALLNGHLYLAKGVPLEQLKSDDPLNPQIQSPTMFDVIFWHGKYFLQHEPLPGVIHGLCMGLTKHSLPTGFAVLFLCFGNFLLIGVILAELRNQYFPEAPSWIPVYCWIVFAISGIQLFLVARPVIYHESIAWGNFFLLCSVALMFRVKLRNAHEQSMVALSGVLIGAAASCRITLIAYPVMFTLTYGMFGLLGRKPKVPGWKTVMAWLAPMAAIALILLCYNYFRFGAFLDFGRTHVIYPTYLDYTYLAKSNLFYRLSHIPINLRNYLFSFPDISSIMGLRPLFTSSVYSDGNIYVIQEVTSSLFVMCPALALIFLATWSYRDSRDPSTLFFILITCAVCCLSLFFSYLAFVRAAPRYVYDFFPLLFIPIFCGSTWLWNRAKGKKTYEWITIVFLMVLLIGSMGAGFNLGYIGSTY